MGSQEQWWAAMSSGGQHSRRKCQPCGHCLLNQTRRSLPLLFPPAPPTRQRLADQRQRTPQAALPPAANDRGALRLQLLQGVFQCRTHQPRLQGGRGLGGGGCAAAPAAAGPMPPAASWSTGISCPSPTCTLPSCASPRSLPTGLAACLASPPPDTRSGQGALPLPPDAHQTVAGRTAGPRAVPHLHVRTQREAKHQACG